MRIISNFKDYYDSVQIHGIDKTKHYIRKTITYDDESTEYTIVSNHVNKLTENKYYVNQLYNSCITKYKTDPNVFKYNQVILFFCGKIFNIVIYKVYTDIVIIKNIEELHDLIISKGNKEIVNKWLKIKNYIYYFKSMKEEYIEFFNIKENKQTLDLFLMFNSPCFCVDVLNKTIITNPMLKDFKFYTTMDSFTTYQNISMYIDNFLIGPPKNLITVSDKIKIDKHGYNKWSFRKEPIK